MRGKKFGSFKLLGICVYHRFMRKALRSDGQVISVHVGLRKPLFDDFCKYCHTPRIIAEDLKNYDISTIPLNQLIEELTSDISCETREE